MKTGHKVIIASINPGQVDAMFAARISELFRERRDRIVDLMHDECSGLLSRARNNIVYNFLAHPSKADWLLMLDSDQQLTLDGFDKLVAAAHDTERPFVAGLYFGAWPGEFYPTPVPLIFNTVPGRADRFRPIVEYPRDQVIEVESAGTGCILVHRSVLEKIGEQADPQHETAYFTDGTSAPRWCWFRDMPVNGEWFSEDHYFCAAARQVGFTLHAHTGVVLPHRKRFWMDDKHHLISHRDMLTDEERRSPRWAAIAGEAAPETTEAPRPIQRAAKPRPQRRRAG